MDRFPIPGRMGEQAIQMNASQICNNCPVSTINQPSNLRRYQFVYVHKIISITDRLSIDDGCPVE